MPTTLRGSRASPPQPTRCRRATGRNGSRDSAGQSLTIAAQRDVEIPIVAHAGDGNVHPAVVYDAADPEHCERAYAAFDDLLRAAIACGGTITGEHGVGRAERHALPEQLGPDVLELNHRIKHALDPTGILNPGAML